MEPSNGKKEEQQAFITPYVRPSDHERELMATRARFERRHRRRRRICGICCCVIGVFLILVILSILLFFIWIWPNPCFHLLDSTAPVQLGVDFQNSLLFVVLTKPIPSGTFRSPLNICGVNRTIDTSILPSFGSLYLSSANFTLKPKTCPDVQDKIDLDHGTLKIIIDKGRPETTVTVEGLNITFSPSGATPNEFLTVSVTESGISTGKAAKGVHMNINGDARIRFDPPIGVIYSKFLAVTGSEIFLHSVDSPLNQCGGHAIGIKLDKSVLHKAWSAFKHWTDHSFPPLSHIGMSQLLTLTDLQIGDVQLKTQPISIETSSDKPFEPEVRAPVTLKKGVINVAPSTLSLTNLSLDIANKEKVAFRGSSRITINIMSGHVEAIANLRKRLNFNISFQESVFDCVFDVDLSENDVDNASNISSNGSSSFDRKLALEAFPLVRNLTASLGRFSIRNATIKSAENSTIHTPLLTGFVEPIFVRSSRHLVSTPQCLAVQKILSLDFVTLNMTVPQGESLKVTFVGSNPDPSPLTINLYRLGRVSNRIQFALSSVCHDNRDNIYPRSEKLMSPQGYNNYSTSFELAPYADDENSMKLRYWLFDAADVDARIYPIENFFQIDKLGVKLNTTEDNKANLDLQISLKQSPTPFFKAYL